MEPFRLSIERRILHFRIPARTSRGDLRERETFLVRAVSADGGMGIGECCTMPGLSPEAGPDYATRLAGTCARVEASQEVPADAAIPPSMRFGLECALRRLAGGGLLAGGTPFIRGEEGIRLHHLIWMADAPTMLRHMAEGVERGFTCLKPKVGALPFAEEAEMLREARRRFPHTEIRVDANGAFTPQEAPDKLEALAEAGVDLIEQPIRPGQWEAMAELCRHAPLPIALDEELIAPCTHAEREKLLDTIHTQALVIKPSLHGGLSGAEDWAALAERRGIRWWVNSALESHVGLQALIEWCAAHAPHTLHGLGTGMLYTDDTPGGVTVREGAWWAVGGYCSGKTYSEPES